MSAALRINHQLGVWAQGSPFRRKLGGCGLVPCAKFIGELSHAVGAISRDQDRELALCPQEPRCGPAVTHYALPTTKSAKREARAKSQRWS